MLLVPVVMIIEHEGSSTCPHIRKQANMYNHSSHSMSTHNRNSISSSETKIILEEIHSHLAITHGIGMTFMFSSFVRFVSKFSAITSSSFELQRNRVIDVTTISSYIFMALNMWIVVVRSVANQVIGFNSMFNGQHGSKSPQVSSRFSRISQRYVQTWSRPWKTRICVDMLQGNYSPF